MLLSRDGGYSSETSREEMIRELETAIALDPSYADAYMLLGYAQGFNGDRAKGLETAQKALALNPRNPVYQFNLAQMYLSNQKFDQAIALLRGLENSGNPVLAAQASSTLRQAEEMKETMSENSDRQEDSDEVTVELRPSTANAQDKEQPPAAPEPSSQGPRTPPKIGFVRGVLTAVDCSSPPSALLTVVAGTKSWKMKVTDTNHVVMLGADKFSCSWARQKVALNYRVTGDAEGTVVSLELE
jgi:tetratricopeptide (TPR) repeat protein